MWLKLRDRKSSMEFMSMMGLSDDIVTLVRRRDCSGMDMC